MFVKPTFGGLQIAGVPESTNKGEKKEQRNRGTAREWLWGVGGESYETATSQGHDGWGPLGRSAHDWYFVS